MSRIICVLGVTYLQRIKTERFRKQMLEQVISEILDGFTKSKFVCVSDPPIVSVSPENVTVNESPDILLSCSYEANPNTLESVSW
jgi:hypothetical protein